MVWAIVRVRVKIRVEHSFLVKARVTIRIIGRYMVTMETTCPW